MTRRLTWSALALTFIVAAGTQCSNEGARGGKPSTGGSGGGAPTGGSGGSTPTGGSGGGATGGTGGGATGGTGGGAMGGAGGGTGGMGGAGGAGGGMGGTGMGGRGGAGGAGGNGGAAGRDASAPDMPTGNPGTDLASFACIKNNFNECFQDSWMMFACFSQAGQDCVTTRAGTACPNQNASLPMEQQGLTSDEYFTVGGMAGRMYKVTISVNGVTEGKYYEMGNRAAGNATPANIAGADGIDGFYTGGQPINQENYNIYKITVRNPPANPAMPASGTEVAHYYLNAMPSSYTQGEAHNTFAFHYTHDITVPGGGVIHYHTADRNCRAVDNCGPGSRSAGCAVGDGRMIPSEPTVKIPDTFMGQPVSGLNTRNGTSQPFHAQLFHITVTAVAPM